MIINISDSLFIYIFIFMIYSPTDCLIFYILLNDAFFYAPLISYFFLSVYFIVFYLLSHEYLPYIFNCLYQYINK